MYFLPILLLTTGFDKIRHYMDEGITGTSAKKRKGFQKMIRVCRQGKIDLIIVKSVSRFARNTLDCLYYVRLLQELGIPIIFETENINTLNMEGEIILTILGATSQAESEAASSRVKWGVRAGFKEGRVRYSYRHWLGYKKGEDDEPEIIPEEAAIVRYIFATFLEGKSLQEIKRLLGSKEIPTKANREEWTVNSIKSILTNEKYTGDVLLQKTYITDPISKKVRKNRGELAQYLVKNCHPAIIDHATFDLVQAEMERRSISADSKKAKGKEKPTYSGKYALSEKIICGECHALYRRVTWPGQNSEEHRIVWRCRNRLANGKRYCKKSPTIYEKDLHSALAKAINGQLYQPEFLLAPFIQGGSHHEFSDSEMPPPAKSMPELYVNLRKRQMILDNKIVDLIARYADSGKWNDETRTFQELLEERARYGEYIQAFQLEEHEEHYRKQIFDLPYQMTEYNDTIARLVLDTVRVVDQNHLSVKFKGGAEIERYIES